MEGFMKKKPVMGAMSDMEIGSTMETASTMETKSDMETKSTMETNMYNLLMAARELGASDLHITVGIKPRSEEHTSELQSLLAISYAVFCLKKIFF